MKMKKIALVYHSADADGFMSAMMFLDIAKKCQNGVSTNIKLFGYNYEKTISFAEDLKEFDIVIFSDVTPTEDWLKNTTSKNQEVLLIDHHQSVYDNLSEIIRKSDFGFKSVQYIFDNTMSASKLMFMTFYHNTNDIQKRLFNCDENVFRAEYDNDSISLKHVMITKYLVEVDDYDVWTWWNKYLDDNSKVQPYITYFGLYEHIKKLSKLYDNNEVSGFLENLFIVNDLHGFLKSANKDIQTAGKKKLDNELYFAKKLGIKEYNGFVLVAGQVNAFMTERISKEYPNAKFVLYLKVDTYNDPSSAKLSLRSIDLDFDVATFAKETFGTGGGHKNAAGSYAKMKDFFTILETINLIEND